MKILYLDCPMGLSGDMFLASMIDAGVDPEAVLGAVRSLGIDPSEIDVTVETVMRHSISCKTFKVAHTETHHHRTWADIRELITKSSLDEKVKDLSLKIFSRVAEAEGRVHGVPAEEVHFHEVGAIDSIIDIVGAAAAVNEISPDRICCSPLPLGSGWADTMHGRIPVPAPATLEILRGAPTAKTDIRMELTTPTGAAIAGTIAGCFGPMPSMKVAGTGYGAGKKDLKEAANLCRAIVGEAEPKPGRGHGEGGGGHEDLVMLETNIDDMNPQVAGYLTERLLDEGALDVFTTPVQMKKSRPGLLVSVLTRPADESRMTEIVFTESTTIGVRSSRVKRRCLERSFTEVETPWGMVKVKVAKKDGRVVNARPEYEDLRRLAGENGVPLKDVMRAAEKAADEELA